MAWTTPRTWGIEIVTAPQLNEQLRDNMTWLYDNIVNIQRVTSVDVAYNASSPLTLFTAPAGSVILGMCAYLEITYNGVAPAVIIGDAADTDGFMTTANTNGGAAVGWRGLAENERGAYLYASSVARVKGDSVETAIIATITVSDATAGKLTVHITYMV